MPIRVRVERVGYYEEHPDKQIRDLLISRTDKEDRGMRLYTVVDREHVTEVEIWHRTGTGVDELVREALEWV